MAGRKTPKSTANGRRAIKIAQAAANDMRRAATAKKLPAFLDALRQTGHVTNSARAADMSVQGVYKRRRADPDFAAAWDEAMDVAIAAFEDEAVRRAVHGVDRLVVSAGQAVIDPRAEPGPDGKPVYLVERSYSDPLLMRLLSAHRPERWASQQRIAGVKDGPPIGMSVDLPPAVAEILNRVRGRE